MKHKNEQIEELAYTPPKKGVSRRFSLFLLVGVIIILLSGGFNLLYAGKAYPGVSVLGAYVGGLNRQQALTAVQERLDDYERELISVSYGSTSLRLSPAKIDTKFDPEKAVDLALEYGRRGSWTTRLKVQLLALAGRPTNLAAYSYSDAKLAPYLQEIDRDISRPVVNASFNVSGTSVTVNEAQPGQRLNMGSLVLKLKEHLANADPEPISAPVTDIKPVIDTASLASVRPRAAQYVDGPIRLSVSGREFVIKEDEIVTWLKLTRGVAHDFEQTLNLKDYQPVAPLVSLELNESKIEAYVADLAKKTDVSGQNAALSITDGRATVFRPSQAGVVLDQPKAIESIKTALNGSLTARKVSLAVKVKKPDVTEDNLNELGIKELISEGISAFPGSTPERLQNIRAGSARYNGVLLKPGEVFSFGELLGDVGPETGYLPSLVIIGTKIEKQYGGGLCQVSSTAYRAALNAGLPILERTNHSYAVSYYTQPYGVPGVDATIYYPPVDFKFRNDTANYILIQTILEGSSLKFQFYGTKEKEGRIRGPFFVTGSLDDTKPSHTVFYRDILVNGAVTKTDEVHTYYKSSKDFTKVDDTKQYF